MYTTKFIIFMFFGFSIFVSTVLGQSENGDQEKVGNNGRRGGFGRYNRVREEQNVGNAQGGSDSSDVTDGPRPNFNELQQIMKNKNLSKQEIEDQTRSFYEKIGGNALKHFNEKQSKMETQKQQFNNWLTSNTQLSDAAKEFFTQIAAIKSNMQITKAEEQQQIKDLYAQASDEVLQEIFKGHGFHYRGSNGRRPVPTTTINESV